MLAQDNVSSTGIVYHTPDAHSKLMNLVSFKSVYYNTIDNDHVYICGLLCICKCLSLQFYQNMK